MRLFPALIFLAVAPSAARAETGQLALAGLEEVARANCGHSAATLDPAGLSAALDGVVGDAMGLRDTDTIIGMIYAGDPRSGARMWASTLSGKPGGCNTLVRMLSQPAADTIAEVQ